VKGVVRGKAYRTCAGREHLTVRQACQKAAWNYSLESVNSIQYEDRSCFLNSFAKPVLLLGSWAQAQFGTAQYISHEIQDVLLPTEAILLGRYPDHGSNSVLCKQLVSDGERQRSLANTRSSTDQDRSRS
jgi:hypothetical protein